MLTFRRKWRRVAKPTNGEVVVTIVEGQPILTIDLEQPLIPLPSRQSSRHRPTSPAWLVVLLLGFVVTFPRPAQAAPYSSSEIIAATNSVRDDHRIASLRVNAQLTEAAAAKVEDMVARQYFAHNSPTGQAPWAWLQYAGYHFTEAGENLAKDFLTANELVASWLSSSGHRRNMLDAKFDEIGVAVQDGTWQGKKSILVVAFFGSRTIVDIAPPGTTTEKKPSVPKPTVEPAVPESIVAAPVSTPPPAPVTVPSIIQAEGAPVPTLALTLVEPTAYVGPISPQPRVLGTVSTDGPSRPAPVPDLAGLMGLAFVIQTASVLWLGIQAGSFGTFRPAILA